MNTVYDCQELSTFTEGGEGKMGPKKVKRLEIKGARVEKSTGIEVV